jgi:hypothetical protein
MLFLSLSTIFGKFVCLPILVLIHLRQYSVSGRGTDAKSRVYSTISGSSEVIFSITGRCFLKIFNVVALLLERGADPDIEDDAGTLPLWFAVDGFSIESVKLLLNANCRYNVQSTQWPRN